MSVLARLLLRLYPAAFRSQFGDEVEFLFRDGWRHAGRGIRGTAERVRLVLDLLRGAVSERWDSMRPAPFPQSALPTIKSRLTMRDLIAEFRQAVRSLARTPGFTLAVILTLGLGIGANTAIFSVVDGVLLRPAPFEDMDRLTMVWETDRKSGTLREPASIPDYFDFQERSKRYEQLAAFSPITVTATVESEDPARLPGLWVSHEFLPMVGIRPIIGAGFTAEQDRPDGPLVALISEALWAERFNRDPKVVGSSIRISEDP